MSSQIDHYAVLGLPSGEESSKLSLEEITKAYRQLSLLCHPDKCPENPNATADFQRLKTSYEFLKDPNSRAAFDAQFKCDVKESAIPKKRQDDQMEPDIAEIRKACETTLMVNWEADLGYYSAANLREIFQKYGRVKNVVMSKFRKGSALVVMASKDAAVAAEHNIMDGSSSPLHVLRVVPASRVVT